MTPEEWAVWANREIKQALYMFGYYNFIDKGARDVMLDIGSDKLKEMTPNDARRALDYVSDMEEIDGAVRKMFVGSCVVDCDDAPEEWFNAFIIGLEKYY